MSSGRESPELTCRELEKRIVAATQRKDRLEFAHWLFQLSHAKRQAMFRFSVESVVSDDEDVLRMIQTNLPNARHCLRGMGLSSSLCNAWDSLLDSRGKNKQSTNVSMTAATNELGSGIAKLNDVIRQLTDRYDDTGSYSEYTSYSNSSSSFEDDAD